ncbi:cohesin domain-containing protein [Desulfonema magnum]|uniref:Cohesin domain-containing protein n=1 Tax=Desulfonema magnum TaxID=45655 RepID=A0A975BMK4_9BACT|nr:cohesin domain-containing protein [Desulfonema magnum]QTA88268.1 Cohesin domain-containing protein [Desulfonema magnum]
MKKSVCLIFGMMFIFLSFAGSGLAITVSPGDVTGSAGQSVTVPIRITNPGNEMSVDAFSFIIEFDESVLTWGV